MRSLSALLVLALLLQAAPAQAGPSDLAGRKVVLDPGHGGSDPGAVGIVQEQGVNLDVALRARDLLQQEGATVLMTRTCDCTVSLADRVALANNNGAHRFISVHSNSCGGCGGTGTETYYHTSLSSGSADAALARLVQEEVVQHGGLRDRGVKQADFYVLRNTAMPAVLLELGFVDTAADAAKLGSPAWRQEAARAILHAVQRDFGVAPHDPGPSDTTPPSTTASLTGTLGDGSWWRSAVTISLAASDPSGIARTEARVDGGPWIARGGPFAVSGEGPHEVQYRSVDGAGNMEAARMVSFAIDSIAPVTSHVLSGLAGDDGWWRSAVQVSLGATDATSGVAATSASRDGAGFAYGGPFAVAGDGAHALTYASRDVAGNNEVTRATALRIDATPPFTALERTGPFHLGAHAFVSDATRFTLAATDATSGVRLSSWAWRGTSADGAGPFGLSGSDGVGALGWRSTDVAGNVAAWQVQDLFLDTTPPALGLDAPAEDSVVLTLGAVTITATATDAGAGVARVEFLVDGVLRATDAAAPYAWAWAAGDEALGEHALEVRAIDHLGHVAAEQRSLTTVPTSLAGGQATLARARQIAEHPPALPVVGVIAEADPADGSHRIGMVIDGAFIGVEG